MEEFKVSIGFKIIFITFIAVFLGLEIDFFVGDHPDAGLGGSLFLIAILNIIILLLISRSARKVIISADSIISVRLFNRKEILTSNVKGFRFKNNGIVIEPLLPTSPKIRIYAFDQLSSCEDLIKWLGENFIDLNAEDRKRNG